jgi:hypothetical protein
MARRTYLFLRLSVVAVIAVLAISLIKDYYRPDPNCLQGSISAYYYTAVQSVFVGALVALGLVFIVLWGKTPGEDAWLNMAGLVAPVVAFVPTIRPTKCGLTDLTGEEVTTVAQRSDLVDAITPPPSTTCSPTSSSSASSLSPCSSLATEAGEISGSGL